VSPAIPITGDADADSLLESEPLALLLGMLLDQQVPMEWAFRGPATLRARLGGSLDAAAVVAAGPEALEATFREKPALHRYPAAMAKRAYALCEQVVEGYGGDAGALWRDATDASELYDRIRALPGYGEEKAKILVAVLGKRLGVRPAGWERVAAPFSDEQPRSVADVDSAESLARVRDWKKAQKAARKGKAD